MYRDAILMKQICKILLIRIWYCFCAWMNEFANKNYRLMLREISYDIENNLPWPCMGEFHRNKEIYI